MRIFLYFHSWGHLKSQLILNFFLQKQHFPLTLHTGWLPLQGDFLDFIFSCFLRNRIIHTSVASACCLICVSNREPKVNLSYVTLIFLLGSWETNWHQARVQNHSQTRAFRDRRFIYWQNCWSLLHSSMPALPLMAVGKPETSLEVRGTMWVDSAL